MLKTHACAKEHAQEWTENPNERIITIWAPSLLSSCHTFLGNKAQYPCSITWSLRTHMLFMWLPWRDALLWHFAPKLNSVRTLPSLWHTLQIIRTEKSLEEGEKKSGQRLWWENKRANISIWKPARGLFSEEYVGQHQIQTWLWFVAEQNPGLWLTWIYFMHQWDPTQRLRGQKKSHSLALFLPELDFQACRGGKCESAVGGSRHGTLQQLVWIIRGVGGGRSEGVVGRRGDSWRQDRASRSERMTITKILAGSHGPAKRGCSWLTKVPATGWAGKWKAMEGGCVWARQRDAPTSTSSEITSSCHSENRQKYHINTCLVKQWNHLTKVKASNFQRKIKEVYFFFKHLCFPALKYQQLPARCSSVLKFLLSFPSSWRRKFTGKQGYGSP